MVRTRLLPLALSAAMLSCGNRGASGRPRVAVSIFPLYDIARRVAGDRLDVLLVLPPGRSEHSFDPTPAQMAQVASARLAVSVGLEMDRWLERIVQGAAGSNVPILQLGPQLAPRTLTQDELGEEEAHAAGGAHHDEHEPGSPDPHFWLDPDRMGRAADLLANRFATLSPGDAAGFRSRAAAVRVSLASLDTQLRERSTHWTRRRIVTFHGSMGYFAERYGLTIAAVIEPFPGREPTARYLSVVLAGVQGTQVAAMFSEPQLDRRPAQVIADQAHVPLFELDPVGGTAGVESYEALLRHNADVLDRALR